MKLRVGLLVAFACVSCVYAWPRIVLPGQPTRPWFPSVAGMGWCRCMPQCFGALDRMSVGDCCGYRRLRSSRLAGPVFCSGWSSDSGGRRCTEGRCLRGAAEGLNRAATRPGELQ